MMKSPQQRLLIAAEIVRRIDTVTLCTCEEVADIYQRALSGDMDSIFEEESVCRYVRE